MKTTHKKNLLAVLCALGLLATCGAHAQDNSAPPPSAPPKFSAADLEKLAAPIALHPDPLIAFILPAAVYPLEIVQAARFVKDTNNIPKVDEQPWDDNVKAVAKFPALIQMMNDDLTWTMDLGQAFLDQQKELMDTIQMLRGKANSAGVLKTTPQQVIVVTNTVIEKTVEQKVVYVTNTVVQIEPSNPQVVYIPTYPPTIYYYSPPPVYVGPPPALTFAAGIAVGLIIANNCDWHGGGIYVGHHGVAVVGGGWGHNDVNINRNVNINTGNINTGNINSGNRATSQKWQPNQSRMSSSSAAGSRASTQSATARGWNSGAAQPRTAPGAASARPSPSPSAKRPSPSPSQSYNRPSPSSSYSRPSSGTSRQSAFGGVGSGASTRQSSSRGSFSRGGGGGGRSSGGRRR